MVANSPIVAAFRRWKRESNMPGGVIDFEAGWREALATLPSINCDCAVCREVKARYQDAAARHNARKVAKES